MSLCDLSADDSSVIVLIILLIISELLPGVNTQANGIAHAVGLRIRSLTNDFKENETKENS